LSKLKLTLACWDYDRTRALFDGTVQPEGIELNCLALAPNETFFRMFRNREFDVSELSLASYSTLKARGDCPFIAIPVFTSRFFRHSCIYVNSDAGIKRPEDLKGKRVGVPEYQVTAAVFVKGMLKQEYGVTAEDVNWFWGGQEAAGRVGVISYQLPERIHLKNIPDGKTLSAMLEAGELDALISPNMPSPFVSGSPKVKRLFPNYKQVEMDYFKRTRIFPIMHTVVLRKEIYEQHPWAAQSLFKAFSQAKALTQKEIYDTDALLVMLPWLIDHIEETRTIMGDDYWPYGLECNRTTLDALTSYLVEQGLAERKLKPEELFAPNTLEEYKI
jgi:4,5-dihydroxyphthalate decarboxylase